MNKAKPFYFLGFVLFWGNRIFTWILKSLINVSWPKYCFIDGSVGGSRGGLLFHHLVNVTQMSKSALLVFFFLQNVWSILFINLFGCPGS